MIRQLFTTLLFVVAIRSFVSGRYTKSSEKVWPECEYRSMCGYLQMNGNSVHVQPLCECRHKPCPLQWDPIDGHTVTHGNDQYKFCERVGRLPACINDQKAYTSYLEMSLLDQKMLLNSGFLHCTCPGDHLFLRNDSYYNEIDNSIAVMSTTYLCKTPPTCDADSICAAVTKNHVDESSFVTRHCACPEGSFCPLAPNMAKEKFDLDKGSVYSMSCI